MSHVCAGETCEHDHSPDRGDEYSLFKCLNESQQDSCQKIFKPWDERFTTEPCLKSDCDEQMILFIPFTGSVKLKSIALIGYLEQGPSHMKAFVNREDVDFDTVDSITPDQEWELAPGVGRDQLPIYSTKITKFSQVRSLTLFFPNNFEQSEETIISYIGLCGEYTPLNKNPIITLYESAPNPLDHKTSTTSMTMNHSIQ